MFHFLEVSIQNLIFANKKLAFGEILINGRDDRIRTCDPLLPKQMHYQAVLHPEWRA